jgi:hypothetical protein
MIRTNGVDAVHDKDSERSPTNTSSTSTPSSNTNANSNGDNNNALQEDSPLELRCLIDNNQVCIVVLRENPKKRAKKAVWPPQRATTARAQ